NKMIYQARFLQILPRQKEGETKMREIKITDFKVEESKNNEFEIIYTPEFTQVLKEGYRYKILFSGEIKEADSV
ncbi:MAG TPA: hypothetical protein ACFYD4_08135, partial [Candidatus Wunengus sp. YC61]|uniref:hypothetical protein n=1 Tax=Candidatus Wunengus sp. YC61 TaxID=3367698 RepID=UPI0040283325